MSVEYSESNVLPSVEKFTACKSLYLESIKTMRHWYDKLTNEITFNSHSNYPAICYIHEKLILICVSLQSNIYCKHIYLQSNVHNKSCVPFKNIIRLCSKSSSANPQRSPERQWHNPAGSSQAHHRSHQSIKGLSPCPDENRSKRAWVPVTRHTPVSDTKHQPLW